MEVYLVIDEFDEEHLLYELTDSWRQGSRDNDCLIYRIENGSCLPVVSYLHPNGEWILLKAEDAGA